MPKIESIRPGGSLSASFAEYPLPDLLFGILRGNLTGRLDVVLNPEPRNRVYFRDGVPIAVDLADAHVSLVRMLIDSGDLTEAVGMDLLRASESERRSEISLLDVRDLVPPGRIRELEARRARAQLVKLFDVGAVDFTFHEGIDRPDNVRLTILQPLTLVYEGLRCTKDRALVERVLEDHKGRSFVLAPTFPHGVDPFDWGTTVEAAIAKLEQEPHTLADLVDARLDRRDASAAIATLLLADMLEPRDKAAKEPKPKAQAKLPPPSTTRAKLDDAAEKEPSGLVIHYKAGVKVKAPAGATSPAQSDFDSVRAKFANYEGKTYYQILRVSPNTELPQIERAYRFLVRRPDGGESDDAASRALKGLYHEAFECLADPERSRRYRTMVEWAEKSTNAARDREALEAEPKADRGFRALGEGHFGEARALLEWAKRLDPMRGDIPLLLGLAKYMADASADPLEIATALLGERQRRPEDERVKMAYAFCLAEDNEDTAARALIDTISDREHPMAKRVVGKIRG